MLLINIVLKLVYICRNFPHNAVHALAVYHYILAMYCNAAHVYVDVDVAIIATVL